MFTDEQLDSAEAPSHSSKLCLDEWDRACACAEDRVFPCCGIERNSDALRTIYHLANKDTWNQGDKTYISQFISVTPKNNYGPYLDILLKDFPCWESYREYRLELLHKSEIDDAIIEYTWADRWILRPLVCIITYAPAVIAGGIGIYFGIMMVF